MSRAWPVANIKPKASVSKNARRILTVRLDELFSYAPIIPDAEAVEQLHNARIAAKRLRYTLELFPAIFSAAGESAVEQIKGVQENLGRIHDADVRLVVIEREIESLTGATDPADVAVRDGLKSLLKRQRTARTRLHRAFVKRWHPFEQSDIRTQLNDAT